MIGASGASCSSVASVARKTRNCCAVSPGCPSVEPRCKRVKVARGGFVSRVTLPSQLVTTLVMPASSNARESNPTDCAQIGHAGTSSAARTAASFAYATICGAVSATKRGTSGW